MLIVAIGGGIKGGEVIIQIVLGENPAFPFYFGF
jgi:hypothetical protein